MAQQKTLDYTLDAMMYALQIYQLSVEHHWHLKFDLKKETEQTVFP